MTINICQITLPDQSSSLHGVGQSSLVTASARLSCLRGSGQPTSTNRRNSKLVLLVPLVSKAIVSQNFFEQCNQFDCKDTCHKFPFLSLSWTALQSKVWSPLRFLKRNIHYRISLIREFILRFIHQSFLSLRIVGGSLTLNWAPETLNQLQKGLHMRHMHINV